MKLALIYGLPGVGKLTVARELAEITGFKLFHIHQLVDMLEPIFGFGSESFVVLRDTIWPLVIRQAIDSGIEGMVATLVFEKSVKREMIQSVYDDLKSHGGDALFVELTCEQSVLEQRVANPDRSRHTKLTSVPVLRELQQKKVFTTPQLPQKPLIIDNTRLSPADAARTIVGALGKV